MNRHLLSTLLCTLCLLLAWPAAAGELVKEEIALTGHGGLQLAYPATWHEGVQQAGKDQPPTVQLTDADARIQLLLTPVWQADDKTPPKSLDEIKALIESLASSASAQAVEKNLPIQPLKGEAVEGYFFAATDKAPKPGEYKYLRQGMLRLDRLTVAFTVLSNDGGEAAVEQAMTVLKTLSYRAP